MENTKEIVGQKTPSELLSTFYKENNLPADGGQNSSSVKIELTKTIFFYFPNFNERRRAVIKHDIHHLLTGYTTSISGESEISAWEIGSGCKNYWAAFFINTSGLMIGLPFNFLNVLKAFARGRRTKNLYHELFSNEQAMNMRINELQERLSLNLFLKDTKPSFTDVILFVGFVCFGTIYSIIALLLLPYIIFYSIYTYIKTN